MEILGYKNHFKAAFVLFFKPLDFWFTLRNHQDKITQASVDRVTSDFEEKVKFLFIKNEKAIIRNKPSSSVIVLMEAPINSVEKHRRIYPSSAANFSTKEKNITELQYGIMDSGSPLCHLKQDAQQALSKALIKGGFIHSRREGRNVQFFINIIE